MLGNQVNIISEITVGDKVFALLRDPSGIEFVTGPILATSTAREEHKCRTKLEALLKADTALYGDNIFGIAAGYQVVMRALAEGLIVENRLVPFSHSHLPGFSKGRIILLGKLWNFFASSTEYVHPHLKAVTVNKDFVILDY